MNMQTAKTITNKPADPAAYLTAAAAVLLLFWAVPAAAQDGRITCESVDENYRYCRVDTNNYVRLVDKLSNRSCDEGSSWGYDGRGIWVDRGCRAEFAYGRGAYNGSVYGDVLAGRRYRDRDDDRDYDNGYYNRNDGYYNNNGRVPNWLVGTFRGYEGNMSIDMTIYADGRVWIKSNIDRYGSGSSGTYRNGRLSFDWGNFRVERDGRGFNAVNLTRRGDPTLYYERIY